MISRNITKRNHIIPCFWSAMWNSEYLEQFINNQGKKEGKKYYAREQKVFSLEFKSGKVLQKKVDDIFCIKNLGVSLVTEAEISTLNRIFSQDKQQIADGNAYDRNNLDTNYIIDAENFFSSVEDHYGYKEAMELIRTGRINSLEEKTHIACFIAINMIRGYKFFHQLVEKYIQTPNPKFEALKHFRAIITSTGAIYSVINPLVKNKWSLYTLDEPAFPLGDTPIIHFEKLIWVIISPKHLIEIDTGSIKGKITYKKTISNKKLITLKTHTIKTSYAAIIFPEKEFLVKMKSTNTWRFRRAALENLDFSSFYV